MELFSIKFMGYDVFIELLDNSVSDKIIDRISDQYDTELWLFGRIHVVASNETAYHERALQQRHKTRL